MYRNKIIFSKQLLMLLFTAGVLNVSFGQTITSPQSTNFMLEAYNIRGRAFVNKDAVNVEGTPLLNTEWGKGDVKFRNGGWVKDMDLKFNLERNELYFNYNGEPYLFNDPVYSFTMKYNNMGKTQEVFFRNGYPINGRLGNETFYEVIADGEKYQFLSFKYAFLSNANSYGGSSNKQIFTNADEFYLFDRIAGKMIRTKKTVAGLNEALPMLADKITKLSAEKKIKLRDNGEIRELFALLNQ
jgi:hypothetical protein